MKKTIIITALSICNLISSPNYSLTKTNDSLESITDEETHFVPPPKFKLSISELYSNKNLISGIHIEPPKYHPKIEINEERYQDIMTVGPLPENNNTKQIHNLNKYYLKKRKNSYDKYADSWAVPLIHTSVFLLGIRGVEALLWEDFRETNSEIIKKSYKDAYTKKPLLDFNEDFYEWDHDRWPINIIGHTLMGSEMYIRSRICKRNIFESLFISTIGTTIWEYVIETSGSHPSGLDLIHTPLIGGLVFGEARYQLWKATQSKGNKKMQKTFSYIIDPFGEFERSIFNIRC